MIATRDIEEVRRPSLQPVPVPESRRPRRPVRLLLVAAVVAVVLAVAATLAVWATNRPAAGQPRRGGAATVLTRQVPTVTRPEDVNRHPGHRVPPVTPTLVRQARPGIIR